MRSSAGHSTGPTLSKCQMPAHHAPSNTSWQHWLCFETRPTAATRPTAHQGQAGVRCSSIRPCARTTGPRLCPELSHLPPPPLLPLLIPQPLPLPLLLPQPLLLLPLPLPPLLPQTPPLLPLLPQSPPLPTLLPHPPSLPPLLPQLQFLLLWRRLQSKVHSSPKAGACQHGAPLTRGEQ